MISPNWPPRRRARLLNAGSGTARRVVPNAGGLPGQTASGVQALGNASATRFRTPFLLFLLVVAIVFRSVLLSRYYITPDADQTVLGLMARHILAGERPVFYWGQPYTGAGEAYLTAALFAVFGQHDLLLHIVPFVASVLFTLAVSALAWRLYGPGIAVLSGIYLCFAPILLIEWGFWAGSGYLEMMALGTLSLILALPSRDGTKTQAWRRLPLCFLLLGAALWTQPTAVFYVLAVLSILVGPALRIIVAPGRWIGGLALSVSCLAMLALGMAPMLLYNIQNSGETLTFLLQRGAGSSLNPLTIMSRGLLWAGPVVLGAVPPTTDRTYLYHFLLAHWALYGVALGVILLLLTRILLTWRAGWARVRTIVAARPAADLSLCVLSFFLMLGFLSSSWGATQWSESQPRYLLPLYTVVPLMLRIVLPPRIVPALWVVVGAAICALVGSNVYVNTTTFSRTDLQPLASLLERQGITAIYGDYWTVYPVMYESAEQIAGVAVNDDLSRGYNRRLLYLQSAAASRHFGWVAATGSARQLLILSCLSQRHSHYRTLVWQDQTIYDAPTGGAYPYWNGGKCAVQRSTPGSP